MTEPPAFVEWLVDQSIPLLALVVGGVWALIALLIHRVVVPRIAGPDGARLGKFEAEVASQLGIVLGLLLSFNAVTVWEQSSAARDATLSEASALREITDLLPDFSPDVQTQLRATLRAYLAHILDTEWPQLGRGSLGLEKPAPLRALARLARASDNQDLHDAVSAAVNAREQRIRIATNRMLPARWSIVVVLGGLALLAIGLVHAEHRRARAVAISMVTFAIASCFVVLLVQVRPFLGVMALKPTELKVLLVRLTGVGH